MKPDSTVFISPSVCPPLLPLPAKQPTNEAATLFLRSADTKPNPAVSSSCSTSLFIAQEPHSLAAGLSDLSKTEQTLIINSDGTHATLITPVVSAEVAAGVQTAAVINPVSAAAIHRAGGLSCATAAQMAPASTSYAGGRNILPAPTFSFAPALGPSLNVETLGKYRYWSTKYIRTILYYSYSITGG